MTKAPDHVAPQPLDKNGNALEPLDLVILGEIPEYYYRDLDTQSAGVLKGYGGRYGLITYAMHERYYNNDKSHPGWVSGDASAVYVLSRAINDDHVSSYDFWLPPGDLLKIPFNMLIMNIFADFPWEMTEEEGPGSAHFVVAGMEKFEFIKRILETPYEILVTAHDSATRVLARNL